eukprot:12187104-Ditylum_brightwellii.AAC.1
MAAAVAASCYLSRIYFVHCWALFHHEYLPVEMKMVKKKKKKMMMMVMNWKRRRMTPGGGGCHISIPELERCFGRVLEGNDGIEVAAFGVACSWSAREEG